MIRYGQKKSRNNESCRIGRKRESEPGKMLLSIGGYAKRTTWLFEAPQNFPEVTRGYSSRFGKVPQAPSPYDTGEASKSECPFK